MKNLIGILLIGMSTFQTYSQQISEYGAFTKSAGSADDLRIVTLSTSIQPTIFLERGAEKYIGTENPTVVMSDVSSSSSLSKILNKYKSIELIELRLKEPSDLNSLSLSNEMIEGGINLKAIVIRSEYHVSEAEFRNIFKSLKKTKITLLYEVSIPH